MKKFIISLGIALFLGVQIDFQKKQNRYEMIDHGCEMYALNNASECSNILRRADRSLYTNSWITETFIWLIIVRMLLAWTDEKSKNKK